jgi:hypothetical protein
MGSDDRELRRRAVREAETLLYDHRERLQPPPGAAETSWHALQTRIAAGESGPLVADDDPPPVRRSRGVVVLAAALAVAAGVALWRFMPAASTASSADEPRGLAAIFQAVDPDGARRAAAAAPAPVPKASRPEPVPEDMPPETSLAPTPEPIVPAVPKDRPTGDLARELAQVRAAGQAVRDGRGADALTAADAYLRAHPAGAFVPEARLHRSEALCLLGRVDEARAAVEAFVRELPDSPLRARVGSVCADAARSGGQK